MPLRIDFRLRGNGIILKGHMETHFYFMIGFIVAFVLLVIYFAKAAVLQFEQHADDDVMHVKEAYLKIIRQKDEMASQRSVLKSEADRIFNLYDLMRDSTKTFNENEAFQVFKEHLHRQLNIEDCQLIESDPKDIHEFSSLQGYKRFPLKSKRSILGELAYKGLQEKDEETFAILAHQFALALRRIKLYKEVEELATTDSLTGLDTRRHFMESFHEEFIRAKTKELPLSLMMIDVDHFKRINDEHGHVTGDQVLREMAQIIMDCMREVDICGRFGGEEFCVVLPDTDKQGGLLVAERIRIAVNEKEIHALDIDLNLSVSVGVASFPEDGALVEELIDKADWALYRAKKSGRNRVVGFSVYTDKP